MPPSSENLTQLRTKQSTANPQPEPSACELQLEKADAVDPAYRTQRRFDRAARLFGEPGLGKLDRARVMIIGVGGVGSFTAEALARSGVGTIDLVDFDRVCITNTNRQLHTMKGNIGKIKTDVMAERMKRIHPTGKVNSHPIFYGEATGETLLELQPDYVVDAIDNLTAKAHLIATCIQKGIPVVSSMGAAGRLDPTQIMIDDLGRTRKDPFARALRKMLRRDYQIGKAGERVGVPAVFSLEPSRDPIAPKYDEGKGFQCVCPGGKNGMHDCDKRRRIDGSASFVTGSFGLVAASYVVRQITGMEGVV